MNSELQQIVTVASGVFAGCLPLVGVIGWAAFQNNHRLGMIEDRLKAIEGKLELLGARMSTAETKIAVVETKLDRPSIVSPVTR